MWWSQPPSLPGRPPCSKHLGVLSQTHRSSYWSLTPHSGALPTSSSQNKLRHRSHAGHLKVQGLDWDHDVAAFATPQPCYSQWPVLVCLWQLLLSSFVLLPSSPLQSGTYPLSESIHPPEEYLPRGALSLWTVQLVYRAVYYCDPPRCSQRHCFLPEHSGLFCPRPCLCCCPP